MYPASELARVGIEHTTVKLLSQLTAEAGSGDSSAKPDPDSRPK